MVRHKHNPTQSVQQHGDTAWNGTLCLRPSMSEESTLFVEPPAELAPPAETSSPLPLSSASNGDRRNVNWDQRRGGNSHPLHGHPGLEPFNDMQILIIDAIAEVGEPASFDQILQSVSSRWRGIKIRRRDGTPYTTDCRRAIQANLRTNPHQVSLFVRVVNDDGTIGWRFSQSIEEAEEAKIKSKTEKSKEPKQSGVEEDQPKSSGSLDGADSGSDEESPPKSPEGAYFMKSARPVRATRHSTSFEEYLSDLEDDGLPSSISRPQSRSSRESTSAYGESYSHDSNYLRSKQLLRRREYMDESDTPPAKRLSVDDLSDSPPSTPLAASSSHVSHHGPQMHQTSPQFKLMQGNRGSPNNGSPSPMTHEWLSASYSAASSLNGANSSSAMQVDSSANMMSVPSVLNLSAGLDTRGLPGDLNGPNGGMIHPAWLQPAFFEYYAAAAAAATAAAAAAGYRGPRASLSSSGQTTSMPSSMNTPVPQFLPHQMSLAQEKAQQMVSGGELASPSLGAWSDRSSFSRRSISSSRTSASTIPDYNSPRTPLSISSHSHHSSAQQSPHFYRSPLQKSTQGTASPLSSASNSPSISSDPTSASFPEGALSH